MLERYFVMKLAPMNAYPLPEGPRAKPSTLRTGKLFFRQVEIKDNDADAFLNAWREIKTFFPIRKDLLALLVAGWHDIIDVRYYGAVEGHDVMEVQGLIKDHGYHHKLESNLQREQLEQLIEKILSAFNPFKEQFPTIYEMQIEPLAKEYFNRP
jgi:hypothetical protein